MFERLFWKEKKFFFELLQYDTLGQLKNDFFRVVFTFSLVTLFKERIFKEHMCIVPVNLFIAICWKLIYTNWFGDKELWILHVLKNIQGNRRAQWIFWIWSFLLFWMVVGWIVPQCELFEMKHSSRQWHFNLEKVRAWDCFILSSTRLFLKNFWEKFAIWTLYHTFIRFVQFSCFVILVFR